MSPEFHLIRGFVRHILEHPHEFEWIVQGFGMLRTYIEGPGDPKKFRLNVWDSALAVPSVSIIHDHPWHFTSWIVNGSFRNIRYVEDYYNGDPYECMTIVTGEGGGPVGLSAPTDLYAMPTEHYKTGDTYHQEAMEVHASYPEDGTVTLNDRTRVGDGERALVFWPKGQKWGDAIPRKATLLEITDVTQRALAKWENPT